MLISIFSFALVSERRCDFSALFLVIIVGLSGDVVFRAVLNDLRYIRFSFVNVINIKLLQAGRLSLDWQSLL